MNTDLLRTFLEVAKTRHFGHASENLFITQAAVSSRVKQLEQILGVPVFSRQRNNILLTAAGERLLPHAENLLASWQLTMQEVAIPKQQNMHLALGGTSNLWDTFLKSMLPRLADKFPSLYIRTEINPPQHLIRALLGGRLDICAMLEAPTNIDLDSKKIGQLDLVLVTKNPDCGKADLVKEGYVFVDWGTAFNLQQARLFDEPVAPILHTGQSHIALEFILSHRGAAYLPRAFVESYLEEEQLFLVCGAEEITQDVHLIYPKKSEKNLTLGAMVQFLDASDIKPDTVPQLVDGEW